MDRTRIIRVALATAAGLAFVSGLGTKSWAGVGQDYVIADDSGYGIADCMKPGMECGRVMADAWCEAHGRGHADVFGFADDVTGSTKISAPSTPHLPSDAVIIRCDP